MSLERWRGSADDPAPTRQDLAATIQAQAALVDLSPAEPAWENAEAEVARLTTAVLELEYTLIPNGLHIMGEAMPADARLDMITVMAEGQAGETLSRPALERIAAGAPVEAVMALAGRDDDDTRRVVQDLTTAVHWLSRDTEMPALLQALDGHFVRPAPGGDLLRNPDVLPTGRNLHGFDPFRIPSVFAMQDGARQAERVLARYVADGQALPETVAIVLWGTDNLKSEGGPIAQALALIGARPRFDGYGRLAGAELLPIEQLGRPRVDIVITLSGIFRDLLPMQVRLLAEACYLAASADEVAGLREQAHLHGKEVAEDPRQRDDAGTPELLDAQRQRLRGGHSRRSAVALRASACAIGPALPISGCRCPTGRWRRSPATPARPRHSARGRTRCRRAACMAKTLGMRNGSKPCKLRPVGGASDEKPPSAPDEVAVNGLGGAGVACRRLSQCTAVVILRDAAGVVVIAPGEGHDRLDRGPGGDPLERGAGRPRPPALGHNRNHVETACAGIASPMMCRPFGDQRIRAQALRW